MRRLTNFSRAVSSHSTCHRPEKMSQIPSVLTSIHQSQLGVLARGNGMSYNDSCFNNGGSIIETNRLNHLLSFEQSTAILTCEAGVTFADLFLAHPDFIPPVIPGTLKATLAGGIAHDIHGKNNVSAGTLGQHIEWLELQIGNTSYLCSRTKNAELFQATMAGLGLTGFIKRVGIKLKKASRTLKVQTEKQERLEDLLSKMQHNADNVTYQVAWLDMQNPFKSILSYANHCEDTPVKPSKPIHLPPIPFKLISDWGISLFNHWYYRHASTQTKIQSLSQFNNPLDSVSHWTRLYGKNGLLQSQTVFDVSSSFIVMNDILNIIRRNRATPTLAVLKYFQQPGCGLLSFVQPGFTLAIDFINNQQARTTIQEINALVTEVRGKSYLAKDLFLTQQQCQLQYPNYEQLKRILAHYNGGMQSDLGRRLGLVS
jgi:FAD/FMN-containing dehydrogenase